jgi:hypothetical protein
MQENEVIIVDGIPPSTYNSLIDEAVRYSLISLPFTQNRMKILDESKRAWNIAKGKIAELLFRMFCQANDIPIDFEPCATPFWTNNNRDFILDDDEWDIKNNFIYCPHPLLGGRYIDLPALVANRFDGDQWSKRNQNLINDTKDVSLLFTFIKGASLDNGARGKDFLEILLTHQQFQYLRSLYSRYKGQSQSQPPFTEESFWEKMYEKGGNNLFRLNFMPYLIITGYANSSHWHLFKDTGTTDKVGNFQNHTFPRWYTKTSTGCSFLKGALWTSFTNSTVPVGELPSFLSLFPQLKSEISLGRIKK